MTVLSESLSAGNDPLLERVCGASGQLSTSSEENCRFSVKVPFTIGTSLMVEDTIKWYSMIATYTIGSSEMAYITV